MPVSNTIITPTMIAKEALMQLRNNLVMGNLVYRDYKKEFVKVGETVSIRKPVKFVASDGATRVNQDVTESTTSITINKQKHVSWTFSMKDLTLSIEEYSARYITPAAIALANIVDSDLCALYKGFFNYSGTAGTTPATFAALGGVAQRLSEFAVPNKPRTLVLNPAAHWAMADGLKGVFAPNRVESILSGGVLNEVAGFAIFEDQNVLNHTPGTASGYTVNGATEGGDGSVTLATGTGTHVIGDIVTFVGCNAVNPVNKQNLGYLMPFAVTADKTTGAGELLISPAIITSGPYQNVTAYPTNGGAVVTLAAHAANMAFHKNALALVMVPLELPDGAAFKAQESHEDLSITVVKDFDIDAYQDIIRLDILYGMKNIYPDLGSRLLG